MDKLLTLYAKTGTNTNSDPGGIDDGQRSLVSILDGPRG
jgi:hypothetical protein